MKTVKQITLALAAGALIGIGICLWVIEDDLAHICILLGRIAEQH